MLLRTVLSFANLIAFVAAILVLETLPQFASIAFYVLVGWMLLSLYLLYRPWTNRPLGGGPVPPTSTGAPLPSGGSVAAAPAVGFCIYCAAPIDPSASRCPACGHARPSLS
ncbi:MAG TPA: hypothetical protein VEL82_04960 [Thermoplasmata archaeon]|nr:hypothetical protein [Thermoplasmata archaeon]